VAKARKRAGGPSGRPRRPTPRETRSRPAAAPAERDRRALTLRIALVVTAVVVGWLLFVRAPGPGTISQAALAAADAAGCSDLERPVVANPVRSHLAPGEGYDYPDPPPASGPHDPTPLPADPHVHGEPVSANQAVHSLEHAYVLIWYRPTADAGPSAETVVELEAVARDEDRVIMAPYPDLADDRALAFVAWNTRWGCPASISPERAVTIARSFIQAYRGTTNAPEAPRGLLGPG
jgi:Protein of unknown function (DUF3105)